MGKITFEEIMKDLAPDVIIKNVHMKNDLARIKYQLNKITVNDFDEFKREIKKYFKYHLIATAPKDTPKDIAYKLSQFYLSLVLGILPLDPSSPIKYYPEDFDYELVRIMLERKYGNIVNAYNITERGVDGGLRAIIDAIAERFKTIHEEGYINSIISKINERDFHHIHSIMKAYVKQYSNFLPGEGKNIDTLMLVLDFREVIKHHIKSVAELKYSVEYKGPHRE